MNEYRVPLLAANWKLNLNWEDCERYVERLRVLLPDYFKEEAELPLDLVLCPAAPYLAVLGSLLDLAQIYVGAQDVSRFDSGAYTGDISATMLADIGCDFAIVGHSERRQYAGDDDRIVGQKLEQLLAQEVVPILCVGEPAEVRDSGGAVDYTLGQLHAVSEQLARCNPGELIIAYEPVWAIGTGRNATPEDAQQMARELRRHLTAELSGELGAQTLILYGGSVKPGNLAGYLEQKDIDGALIGGASLDPEAFAEMVLLCTGLAAKQI